MTTMERMFKGATSFHQDLGWCVVTNVDTTDAFTGSGCGSLAVSDTCGVSTLCFTSKSDLVIAVGAWIGGDTTTYGHVSAWDVSAVTDMAALFSGTNFNDDISGWDVSRVTTMEAMFLFAYNFNQDLGSWNVSRVENMYAAPRRNQDGSWPRRRCLVGASAARRRRVGGASSARCCRVVAAASSSRRRRVVAASTQRRRRRRAMFYQARVFNQSIGSWDVARVTTMERMFEGAAAFEQDLGWRVSTYFTTRFAGSTDTEDAERSQVNTQNVFLGSACETTFCGVVVVFTSNSDLVDAVNAWLDGDATYYTGISKWDVSAVTDMSALFSGRTFDDDISAWDMSSVTSTQSMFYGAAVFNQDIGTWTVSSVADMSFMFFGAAAFDQDIDSWDVANRVRMSLPGRALRRSSSLCRGGVASYLLRRRGVLAAASSRRRRGVAAASSRLRRVFVAASSRPRRGLVAASSRPRRGGLVASSSRLCRVFVAASSRPRRGVLASLSQFAAASSQRRRAREAVTSAPHRSPG